MKEKELRGKIRDELERMGFVLWFAPAYGKMRWDIFTIFDLVAVHKSTIAEVNFIQFTTMSHVSHRRRKIFEWMIENDVFVPNAWLYCYDLDKETFKIHPLDMDELLKFKHREHDNEGRKKTEFI